MVQPFLPNSADAFHINQAEPDTVDFEILLNGLNGSGTLTGCIPTAGTSLSVTVGAGTVRIKNGSDIPVTGETDKALAAADGSNPRFDLVVIDTSGDVQILTGTPAAQPVLPELPVYSMVVIAAVYVPASTTNTIDTHIIDKRIVLPSNVPSFTRLASKWDLIATVDASSNVEIRRTDTGDLIASAVGAPHQTVLKQGSDWLQFATGNITGGGMLMKSLNGSTPFQVNDEWVLEKGKDPTLDADQEWHLTLEMADGYGRAGSPAMLANLHGTWLAWTGSSEVDKAMIVAEECHNFIFRNMNMMGNNAVRRLIEMGGEHARVEGGIFVRPRQNGGAGGPNAAIWMRNWDDSSAPTDRYAGMQLKDARIYGTGGAGNVWGVYLSEPGTSGSKATDGRITDLQMNGLNRWVYLGSGGWWLGGDATHYTGNIDTDLGIHINTGGPTSLEGMYLDTVRDGPTVKLEGASLVALKGNHFRNGKTSAGTPFVEVVYGSNLLAFGNWWSNPDANTDYFVKWTGSGSPRGTIIGNHGPSLGTGIQNETEDADYIVQHNMEW